MSTAAVETGLAEATRRIAQVEGEIADENRRHEREASRLDRDLAEAKRRRDLVLTGTPLETVELAESVIEVYRPENVGVGEGRKVTLDAIRDLADGAPALRRGYMGTKNYDRWSGQAEGGDYGTGPRHGTTIFAIRLTEPFRARSGPEREMTAAECDAAIAYLHALLGTLARP
jgi:hypothetical protein